MIKQIFMVATAHPLASEKAVADAFKKAETELNEAINEGYILFAHYPVNAHQLTGQMFVMHKPDQEDFSLLPMNIINAWRKVDEFGEQGVFSDWSPDMSVGFNDRHITALLNLADAVKTHIKTT